MDFRSQSSMRLLLLLCFTLSLRAADEPMGAQLYRKHCATCHESGGARIPPTSALRLLPVGTISKALEFGVMRSQASALGRADRFTLALWLGSSAASSISVDKLPNRCSSTAALSPTAPAWSGWGVGLDNRRFQSGTAAGLTAADIPRLRVGVRF